MTTKILRHKAASGWLTGLLGACCFLLSLPGAALAQETYPTRPVRLLIPYAAGGVGDIAFRIVSPLLEKRLGQRIIVENKPGASGNIGAEEVLRAPADGYTLLLGAVNNFATNQFLYKNMEFDPVKAFDPVALLLIAPTVVAVKDTVPVRSLRELAEYARANPLKLNFGSPGVGTPPQLAAELFDSIADVQMVHVPFNSTPQVMLAIQQNSVHVAFYTMAGIVPLLRGGTLRPLAVAAASRLAALPEVPTTAEAGYPGLVSSSWQGFAARRGTDPRILDRLNSEIRGACADPQVQRRYAETGMVPGAMTRPELASFVREEAQRWKRVIESAHIER